MKAEAARSAPIARPKPNVWIAVNDHGSGFVLVFKDRVSYRRIKSGGKRSIGCMDRYAAKDKARMKVMLAPWEALAMAVRMKRLLKADVDRAMQVAIVKGLRRKLGKVNIGC